MTTEYYIEGYLLCEEQKHKNFMSVRKNAKNNYLFVVSVRPPTPWSNTTPTKKIYVKFYI